MSMIVFHHVPWFRCVLRWIGALALIAGSVGHAEAPPTSAISCSQRSDSWSTTNAYDTKQFGKYFVSNDNFNGTPNQKIWATSEQCFGVTTTATTERRGIGSYPHVVRGWMENDADMRTRSSTGTMDWTQKSGLGLAVTHVSKAKVHWAFRAPTDEGARWNALLDIYFHKSATAPPGEFPPAADLQVIQSLQDQVIGKTTFYAIVAGRDHSTTVTLGGIRYLLFIDDPGGVSFHQPGGHTITLFNLPTAVSNDSADATWGTADGVTDVAAIIKFFMQANPLDDAGRPLQNAAGVVITSPLIPPDLFLTAINAGWEIDVGTLFTNGTFCVALQDEPDCR